MLARRLLVQARTLYDDTRLPFARIAAHQGWQTGFASGAEWMRSVMAYTRGVDIPPVRVSYNILGLFKYGVASLCTLIYIIYIALTVWLGWWLILPGFVPIFYAVEAQMVFLFPLAIDGYQHPLHESRALTRRAGGTLPVMGTVMPIAGVMLFGGFVGGGFIRSWALGCLAIALWYEEVRVC
jgi:hypothetical protein